MTHSLFHVVCLFVCAYVCVCVRVCVFACGLVGDLNEETILAVSEEEDAHTKGLVLYLFMLN